MLEELLSRQSTTMGIAIILLLALMSGMIAGTLILHVVEIIFNSLMVDWDEPVVLVEGVFDAIVVGDNAIPILGSTLREDSKLFQALAIHDTPVYVALDADAEKKAHWIIKSLMKYDLEVKKINIEEFEDIGSMSRQMFLEKLKLAEEIDSDIYFLEKQLRSI